MAVAAPVALSRIRQRNCLIPLNCSTLKAGKKAIASGSEVVSIQARSGRLRQRRCRSCLVSARAGSSATQRRRTEQCRRPCWTNADTLDPFPRGDKVEDGMRLISMTYAKCCFGPRHIHHGSRHVHPQSAWVFGVPGYLTIEYESGKWTRQSRRHVPRSEPLLRFWDWAEVSHYLVAERTQGLDNLYGQQNVPGKTAKPKPSVEFELLNRTPEVEMPEKRL